MSLTGGLSAGLVAGLSGRAMAGVSAAWTPGDLPGTPREWLAGPDWCYTDGSAAFAAASAQYLSVASNSTLQVGDVDFWVAGWVWPGGTENRTVASKWEGSTNEWLVNVGGGQALDFYIGSGGFARAGVVNNGAWAFMMAYHDSANNTIGVSLNGGAFVTDAASSGPVAGNAAFMLGGRGGLSNPLDGRLASVAFGKAPPGGIAALATTIRDRLYASGNGIVYADTTAAERTDWGLVSWWDLVRSGVFTDSHGTNNLTNNNGVTFGAGLPRSRAGDTDPISAWVDRWQGTTVSQSDPLKRPTLRLVGGKWCVRFDGVNDVLSAIGMNFPGALTLAARFSATAPVGYNARLIDLAQGGSEGLQFVAATDGAVLIDNSGGPTSTISTAAGVIPSTVTMLGTRDATPTYRLYTGGTLRGTSGGTSPTYTRIFIGNRASLSLNAAADIASIPLTNAVLTADERALLEAYLAGVM